MDTEKLGRLKAALRYVGFVQLQLGRELITLSLIRGALFRGQYTNGLF